MKIRSFIAVDPSPEVTAKIAETIRKIEPQTRGFRWIHPEGIHLTLRFLGEVEEEVLETISQRIEQLTESKEPISLTASGIGFFPDPSRPRVVWIGLQGDLDRLERLQREIHEAVRGLPVHQEKERGFTPHLTVARIPDFHKASGIVRILEAAKSAEFGNFSVETVILYKSNLTPQGAKYTKLKEFKLGRP
jgi:2'-5' RNA ligase